MGKPASENEVNIPITHAFEKRFAELAWENCSELARQTVAGKIAMSVEVDDQFVYSVMQREAQAVVSVFLKENESMFKDKIGLLIAECLKGEVTKAVRSSVKQVMDNFPVAKEVGNMVRVAVNDEATILVNAWINKNLVGRVDRYLDEHLPAIAASLAKSDVE